MKKLLIALLLLLLPTSAYAQKTKAALTTEVGTNLASGTAITASTLRTTLIDMINSWYDLNGLSSSSCASHQWVSAFPTLSSVTCTQPAFADISGSIAPTQIPPPTATTLGGIESITSLAHNWIAYIDTSGVPHQSQPAVADISGFGTGIGTALGVAANTAGGLVVPTSALTSFGVVYGGGSGASPGSTAAGTSGQLFLGASSAAPQWGTMSGDATIGNTGVLTLATVNANTGPIGSASTCLTVTNNAKGLTTAVSSAACTPALANITGFGTGVGAALAVAIGSAGAPVLFNGAGGTPTSITLTNATGFPFATGGTGTVPLANGGTNNALTASNGGVVYSDASKLNLLAGTVTAGQCLLSGASTSPTWGSCAGGATVTSVNTQTGAITLLTEAQGRLTLQANTPVMTTSQSSQTTLRYDAYIGNQVPYYTGSADAIDTIASNEVTDVMVSAASAGQVVSGQVYDVWWVHGGANRICLAMSSSTGGGGGWASDTGGSSTARGTGYSQLDKITRPYITNKNSISNCFNAATNYGPVSANQGTYLGTVTASANGQISFTLGTAAAGGGAGIVGVWNNYNRRPVTMMVEDTFNNSTVTAGTITALDATGTGSGLNNRVTYVIGDQQDSVLCNVYGSGGTNVAGGLMGVACGHNSTSAVTGLTSVTQQIQLNAVTGSATVNGDLGLNFFQALQHASGQAATTYGNGTGANIHTGMNYSGQY